MIIVGNTLRQEREKRGLSIDQVSNATKISSAYINAIENEDIGHLPKKVYSVGFVRLYANFLSLDAEQFASEFKTKIDTFQRERIVSTNVKLKKAGKQDLSYVFVLILYIYVISMIYSKK